MIIEIPNRYKKFNPELEDTIKLTVIECKNCGMVFAVERWKVDTACPLCGDNAIRDYETLEYLDHDIGGKGDF